MTPEYKTALVRGAISGAFLAGVSFFAIGPQYGVTAGLWAAGAAFFGTMGTRFAAEGTIDSKAANKTPSE